MKDIKKLIKDIEEQEEKAEEKRQNNYLKDILRQHLAQFKELKSNFPNKTDDEIIYELLNQSFIQRLKNLGIKDATIISGSYSANINSIVEQLNGKHISAEQLDAILTKFSEGERQYILEILAKSLNVPNSKEISKRMQIMHKTLIKHNGGKDKGIYYIIQIPNSQQILASRDAVSLDITTLKC